MSTVFLSYARYDIHFARLAESELQRGGITVWRDEGKLRAGEEWRSAIDRGVSDSIAVLVALSEHSFASSFVTYEWAYAMGSRKPVIPLKLRECQVHPRLQPIQWLDFSEEPFRWDQLIQRIQEIEGEPDAPLPLPGAMNKPMDPKARTILDYLERKGFQMLSYERVRQGIIPGMTEDEFTKLVNENSTIFRHARLKGGKAGLARLLG